MGLDIRWPIGLMFSLVGLAMTVFGLATNGDAEMYHRSLDININLVWGIVLLVFGGFMLWLAARQEGGGSPDKNSPSTQSPPARHCERPRRTPLSSHTP